MNLYLEDDLGVNFIAYADTRSERWRVASITPHDPHLSFASREQHLTSQVVAHRLFKTECLLYTFI